MSRLRLTGFVVRRLASPWLLALGLAVAAAVHLVTATATQVQRAAAVARTAALLRAQLAADEAVLAAAGRTRAAEARTAFGGRVEIARAGAAMAIAAHAGGQTHWFAADLLPGAVAAEFTHAVTAGEPGSALPPACRIAPLSSGPSPTALARGACAAAAGLVVADASVALRRFAAGTDGPDFVFAADAAARDLAGLGDVVVVPGHLWLTAASTPATLRCGRDVVLAVRGNIYVERSLRVDGEGRLVLVVLADQGQGAYIDADGDGRCGAGERRLATPVGSGWIEGAGSVVVAAGAAAPLALDGALWVAGALHLQGDLQVAGPTALAHGVTALAPTARLVAAGRWRFHAERDAVAGFPTHGPARPGFLRPTPSPGSADRTHGEEPLYLSGSLR